MKKYINMNETSGVGAACFCFIGSVSFRVGRFWFYNKSDWREKIASPILNFNFNFCIKERVWDINVPDSGQ